ncbi:ABC transporter permease [Chloroflexota bacterium]
MRAYVIRRLFLIVPTLFFVTLIVFFIARFIPGSVIDLMLAQMGGEDASMTFAELEATAEGLKHALGLDLPVHIQYGRWIGVLPEPDTGFDGILQGNLGVSLWGRWSIGSELLRRYPITLELGVTAMLIAFCVAMPVGVYAAIRQDTTGDYVGRSFAILAISLPTFWLGTMVTVYPSIWWNWSPPITYIPLSESITGNLAQFLLPAAIQGFHSTGSTMRMTRTMMLEVMRHDYIRTAWAKGLGERTIIYRHALKNALIPVVTLIGNHVHIVIGGSVIMEQIFNLPGIGRLMISALNHRDYPVISAINLVIASFIVCVNLLVDLSYAWLDPRVVYK